jgi:hypothetical protein
MESYLLDWANLLLRWAHLVTAIAWIGSSFYFLFLDSSLTPPVDEDLKRQGVSGELWAVHGGGFYHPVKFNVAPPRLPAHLHWFFWESYSTWLTGFALFTISYLWSAGTWLIDRSVMDWSPGAAIGVALSFLVVFWLLYDAICRWFGQRESGDQGRLSGRRHPRQARQAAQRAQHLLHAAGAVRDDEQPLQFHLEPPAQLAGARPDDVRRRGHPAVLRHAPRLEAGPQPPSPALCAGGCRSDCRCRGLDAAAPATARRSR